MCEFPTQIPLTPDHNAATTHGFPAAAHNNIAPGFRRRNDNLAPKSCQGWLAPLAQTMQANTILADRLCSSLRHVPAAGDTLLYIQ